MSRLIIHHPKGMSAAFAAQTAAMALAHPVTEHPRTGYIVAMGDDDIHISKTTTGTIVARIERT